MAKIALWRDSQQNSDGDPREAWESETHTGFRRPGEAWRWIDLLRSGLVGRGAMVAAGGLWIGVDQVRTENRRPRRAEGFRPAATRLEKREGYSGLGARGQNAVRTWRRRCADHLRGGRHAVARQKASGRDRHTEGDDLQRTSGGDHRSCDEPVEILAGGIIREIALG